MSKSRKSRQSDMLVLDTALRELSAEGDLLERLDALVDWERFRPELVKALGREGRQPGDRGRPPFDEVLMFKVLVIKKLHGLSDAQTAYQVKDRVSCWRFLGLQEGGARPDEKTVWKFGNDLAASGVLDQLWEIFDGFLSEHGLRAGQGQVIDATLVPSPRQRISDEQRSQVASGVKPEGWTEARMRQADPDARWSVRQSPDRVDESGQVKKGLLVATHGFKGHINVDVEHKLIRKRKVTDAASHDCRHLPELLDKSNQTRKVRADSAYGSKANEEAIRAQGLFPLIVAKKPRGRRMPRRTACRNAKIAKVRSRGEHPFAELKCRMGLCVRTKGLKRADFQIGMACLVYNMKRCLHLLGTAAPA